VYFEKLRNYFYLEIERIEGFNLINYTVDHWFLLPLWFKRSEHSIPNNQDASIILVDAILGRSCTVYANGVIRSFERISNFYETNHDELDGGMEY